MRKRWIYPSDGSEPYEVGEGFVQEPRGPFVMPDIQPYQSMVTGETITSRSHHRAHLKQHGKVEIGNELPPVRSREQSNDSMRRELHHVFTNYGY